MANGKTQSWLSLLNYSSKHNVSLSTLRRRIKSHAIEYKLDQGKYFILEEGQKELPIITPPPLAVNSGAAYQKPPEPVIQQQSNYVEASVLSSANRLVEEIKSAYAKILQEKEEQISLLKEEMSDLKMLVRILESQGASKEGQSSPPLTLSETSPDMEPDDHFLFDDYQNRL